MTTTDDKPATTIIRSDRGGRPRYSPAYREEVLDAYEASGMSGPPFARHCGIKYPTFAGWAAGGAGLRQSSSFMPNNSTK